MDWYPHYIADYDADTLHLTIAEDGAYSRLLRWYYHNERPLPTDDVALASICRIGIDEWVLIKPKILPLFVTRDTRVSHAGVMHHKRCDRVILDQNRRRKDWKSRQEKLRKNNILEDVTRESRECHASIGKDKEEKNDRTESVESLSQARINIMIPAAPDGFAEFFKAMPKRTGKGDAEKAYRAALKSGAKPDVILEMAQRYAEERKGKDPQYTKTPGPWLRARRWEDEPILLLVPPYKPKMMP